jgi:hypothetical protein
MNTTTPTPHPYPRSILAGLTIDTANQPFLLEVPTRQQPFDETELALNGPPDRDVRW